MITRIEVLDKGFISLIDMMGSDYSIIRAARVSTGNNIENKDEIKDRKLIRYLYKNKHLSPFEMVTFTFHIRSPLFVNQQLLRHRSFSFNQESGRYKKFKWDYFLPAFWRKQDAKNKQGSIKSEDEFKDLTKMIIHAFNDSEYIYEEASNRGVSNELSRIVMPMAQYTETYFTCDLRNLLHFLELRLHKHAQEEIREYAEAILIILKAIPDLKWTMEIFDEIRKLEYTIQEKIGLEDGVEELTKYISSYKKDKD